jgi:hypothetical protein
MPVITKFFMLRNGPLDDYVASALHALASKYWLAAT